MTGDDGVELGVIEEVFDDDVKHKPEWALVRSRESGDDHLVPVGASEMVDGTCRVPYTAEKVAAAPSLNTADQHISPEQEELLRSHYGIGVITTTWAAGSSAEE
ncbi:hypothetical protein J4573_42510 [Actinomadura barringtoniae]|uniref:PRC-barrel domain containing protein n=1 Tax=Actinomadura barringtoniae TaxID=1427535 RepID=A0A939PPM4_9ACTN|nr:hypothetical protein [Actinomadura barringtoniae]MBO2453824.1 hypothetical protein [Actinomadura barringtoniae]